MQGLIAAIDKNNPPSSTEVQQLMQKHYYWFKLSWTPTKESYIGLTQLYQQPEFASFYDARHPKLLQFMVEAMSIFAELSLLD